MCADGQRTTILTPEHFEKRKPCVNVLFLGFVNEIVRRIQAGPGMTGLPRPLMIERIFGWLTYQRRLACDDEQSIDGAESKIHVAMRSPLLRRVSPCGHSQTASDERYYGRWHFRPESFERQLPGDF